MVQGQSLTMVTLALGLPFVRVALGSEDLDVSVSLLQSKIALKIATPCGTNTGACVFPFKYKNVMYDSCTLSDGNGRQPWCATDHQGSWDHCVGSCSTPAPEKCITTSSLTTLGKACVFPFKYEGVMYNSCMSKDNDRLWCATEVDKDGAMVVNLGVSPQVSWGDCGSCVAGATPSPLKQNPTNLAIVDELMSNAE